MNKILLADNNTVYGEGIKHLLEDNNDFTIIDFAAVKYELEIKLKELIPDILILDIDSFPDIKTEDLKKLLIKYPETGVLVLTYDKNKDTIFSILKSGIKHFLIKDCKCDEFLKALYALSANEKYLSSYIAEVLLNKKIWDLEDDKKINLTNKEIEIIKLIAHGLTTKDIATKIFISYHTVNTHRKNIFAKLNINNTSELVMYAVKKGIVDTIEYYI